MNTAARQRLRAVIYIRLSGESDDATTSIKTQEADGRALCKLRGWDVVRVIVDDGVSGAIRPEEREGFSWIFSHLHEIDVVVARSVDRFSRVTSHFATLVESLDKADVTLTDTQGQCDLTSPYGRFITTIMIAFAEMEREIMRSRILRSKKELRQTGRWSGGAAPYGTITVPAEGGGKRLAVEGGEASDVILEVVDRVIDGHRVSHEIDRLNASSHLAPSDYRKAKTGQWFPPMVRAAWSYSVLYQCLRSEVLRGYQVEGKRGTRTVVRNADGSPVRAGEALLSDEKWFALQAALDKHAQDPHRPRCDRDEPTLLLHVAVCEPCDDGAMHYNQRREEYQPKDLSKPVRVYVKDNYVCRNKRPDASGKLTPHFQGADARRLEAMVEEFFLARFGAAEYTRRVLVAGSDPAHEIEELEADIRELSARTARLRGTALDAVLDQLQGRSDRLEELRARPVEESRWISTPTGQTVGQKWKSSNAAGRRLLLLEFGVKARVRPPAKPKTSTWDPARVTITTDPALWDVGSEMAAVAADAA